jgi:hypothetical protein
MAKTKQCKVSTKQGQRLDHTTNLEARTSKPRSPDSADLIAAEIEASQRCAMPQHSCKTLYPCLTDPW